MFSFGKTYGAQSCGELSASAADDGLYGAPRLPVPGQSNRKGGVFGGGRGEGSLIVVGRGYSLFYSFIPEGDGACYVVDAIELLYKVCGLSASGRCFSGVALNYPFTTRGAIPDLFLLHSSAPPTAAHSDSRGQG